MNLWEYLERNWWIPILILVIIAGVLEKLGFI